MIYYTKDIQVEVAKIKSKYVLDRGIPLNDVLKGIFAEV